MLLEDRVAIDSFHHKSDQILYFCSHAHDDHLRGLHANWRKGQIFCSQITATLLALRWPALQPRLSVLQLGVIHSLRDSSGQIQVLLVDADHVPGSVMFVISGLGSGTCLYTGDFRTSAELHAHLACSPLLRDGLGRIYLDSTFCHPRFDHPSRQQATAEAVRLARRVWPCMLFVAAYQLGKEPLLEALADALNTKIVVSPARHATLGAIGCNLEKFLRTDRKPEDCSEAELRRLSFQGCIWVVAHVDLRQTVDAVAEQGVATHGLMPSGWATQKPGVDACAYSDHSSFLELVQFLSWLPVAPVTFLSCLPSSRDGSSTDGVKTLMHLAGVPNVSFLAGKRKARVAKTSQHFIQLARAWRRRRTRSGGSLSMRCAS